MIFFYNYFFIFYTDFVNQDQNFLPKTSHWLNMLIFFYMCWYLLIWSIFVNICWYLLIFVGQDQSFLRKTSHWCSEISRTRKATASTSSDPSRISRLVFPSICLLTKTTHHPVLVNRSTNVLSSDIIVFRGFKLVS